MIQNSTLNQKRRIQRDLFINYPKSNRCKNHICLSMKMQFGEKFEEVILNIESNGHGFFQKYLFR